MGDLETNVVLFGLDYLLIFLFSCTTCHIFPFLLYFCDKDFHLKKYYICFIFIIIVKYNYIPFKTHHKLSFAM